MNLEIFLSEHSPENSLPPRGSFWTMPSPIISSVSEISEQAVRDAIFDVFSSHAPSSDKISPGLYFQIFFDKKQIFGGHIKANGEIDSMVKN